MKLSSQEESLETRRVDRSRPSGFLASAYHSSLAIGHRTGNKCHCSHEEKVHVACEEIRLSGTSRNLNLDLSLTFPDQTFEVGSLNLFMTLTSSMCATSLIITEVLSIILRISLL